MKYKKIILSSLFSISLLAPAMISSCSSNSSENDKENEKDPDNSGTSGDGNKPLQKPDSGNKPVIPDSNPSKPDNNNKPNIPDSNPDKPSEIINSDLHQYNLSFLENKTPNEIFLNSNTYKLAFANMNKYLNKDEIIDNDNYFRTSNNKDEYIDNLKGVGMYGNFGNTRKQKISVNPYLPFKKDSFEKLVLKQKFLENFDDNINCSEINISDSIIKTLISNNPYGYLPSNVSQYLYLISLKDLENLFLIKDISELKANFDDSNGTIKILISDKKNKTYSLNLSKENTKDTLKKDSDFYQYIFDRSLMVSTNLYEYKRNQIPGENFYVLQKPNQGTMWALDRIEDNDNENYTFLMGTNMHVLSYVNSFDRNVISPVPSENLKKYWNGGFVLENDKIETFNINRNKYQTIIRNNKNEKSNLRLGKWNENNVNDIVTGDASNGQKINSYDNNSINSNDYLDRIWYTPLFNSKDVSANNSSNNEEFLIKQDGEWITRNSGSDFVITKIKIPKNDLVNYFPTLVNLINTAKEKDWYIKMPETNNNLYISPNQTFYTADYPGRAWSQVKSTGGFIQTQIRNIENDDTVSYWTKYNKEINEQRNRFPNRYKEDFKNNYNNFEHGMTLSFTIQNSILNLYNKENRYQPAGSSGSLTIDSKFNSIGILFSGLLKEGETDSTIPSNFFTNQISLFNSTGSYKNWNGNMKDDIIKKLSDEKTYSISLNPKN